MSRWSEDVSTVGEPDLVSAIREFARRRVAPEASSRDRERTDAADIFRELADMSSLGITVSEQYHGLGLDTPTLVAAIEELAYADASVASIFAGHYLGMEGFRLFGDDFIKETFLSEMAQGRLRAAFALTEPEAGSDISAMRTTATLDGGNWRIQGSKIFISSAAEADILLLFAKTDPSAGFKGISAFVVPTRTSGISFSPPMEKMGMRGEHAYEVHLSDVTIPENHLVGTLGGGGHVAMGVLNPSRIDAAALANGIAMRALDLALAHASHRVQFGKPIRDFQAIQLALGRMDCLLETARLATYRVAHKKDSGEDIRREASVAKYVASENAFQVVDAALQIFGGSGYMAESEIERLYRDVRVIRLYEGTSDIQLLTISKQMIRHFDDRGTLF